MSNTKTKAKAPAKKRGPNNLEETAQSGDDEAMTKARNIMAPSVRGAVTTQAFSGVYGETDLTALIKVLAQQNGIDGRPQFAKLSIDDGGKVEIAAIDPDFDRGYSLRP